MPLETFERLPQEKRQRIIDAGIRAFGQKSYQDVRTEFLTKECQISKGLLFHYFGSKKEYYLYCLKISMERLTGPTAPSVGVDFYEILFDSMKRKMEVCMLHPNETYMVNMASRELSAEIAREKSEILRNYRAKIHMESAKTMKTAAACLNLKESINYSLTLEALHLYVNAVLNRYLLQYQQTPDRFFENRDEIQKEMRKYLDLMLFGICE